MKGAVSLDDAYLRRIETVQDKYGPAITALGVAALAQERALDAQYPHSFVGGIVTDPEHLRLRRELWAKHKASVAPLSRALQAELQELMDENPGHPFWEGWGSI